MIFYVLCSSYSEMSNRFFQGCQIIYINIYGRDLLFSLNKICAPVPVLKVTIDASGYCFQSGTSRTNEPNHTVQKITLNKCNIYNKESLKSQLESFLVEQNKN